MQDDMSKMSDMQAEIDEQQSETKGDSEQSDVKDFQEELLDIRKRIPILKEAFLSIMREKLREVAIEVLNCMYKSESSWRFRRMTNRQKWLNRFVQLPVGKAFFAIEQGIDIDSFATVVRATYDEHNQYLPSTDRVVLRAQSALEQYHALLQDGTETDSEIHACAAVVRQCKLLLSYKAMTRK